MSRDVIGDLFGEPKPKQTGWLMPFVLGVVVTFGGVWVWNNQDQFKKRFDERKCEQVVVEGGYVVLIREARDVTLDQELVERSMSEYVAARGLTGFRILDDDQPEAKPFLEHAATRGVSSPLIAFVDKDKYIRKVAAFPADYTALEAFLK